MWRGATSSKYALVRSSNWDVRIGRWAHITSKRIWCRCWSESRRLSPELHRLLLRIWRDACYHDQQERTHCRFSHRPVAKGCSCRRLRAVDAVPHSEARHFEDDQRSDPILRKWAYIPRSRCSTTSTNYKPSLMLLRAVKFMSSQSCNHSELSMRLLQKSKNQKGLTPWENKQRICTIRKYKIKTKWIWKENRQRKLKEKWKKSIFGLYIFAKSGKI